MCLGLWVYRIWKWHKYYFAYVNLRNIDVTWHLASCIIIKFVLKSCEICSLSDKSSFIVTSNYKIQPWLYPLYFIKYKINTFYYPTYASFCSFLNFFFLNLFPATTLSFLIFWIPTFLGNWQTIASDSLSFENFHLTITKEKK